VKKPTKKFKLGPIFTKQEEFEHALFDAVMGVFEKLEPSNITVVHTMMRIAAHAAIYGGGNVDGFVKGARGSFEESAEAQRRATKESP
jgi:hypothetical protein